MSATITVITGTGSASYTVSTGARGPAGSAASVTADAVTAVLDDNAAANRTALGLGTAATTAASAYATAAQGILADSALQNSMSTNKLLGRGTAGTGAIEEITLGTNLSLSGTTLNAAGGGFDPTDIGFYDNFHAYENGTQITDGVTLPLAGTAWNFKANDAARSGTEKPFIMNGGLQFESNGSGYLAAHATPADIENFSYGFEFTREWNAGTSPVTNFTITVGKSPLVAGGTHNAYGRLHMNIMNGGIVSLPVYAAQWAATVNTTTNQLTLGAWAAAPNGVAEHSLQTGDHVQVYGTVPAPLVGVNEPYFAIVDSPGVVRLATSRANALAGTAIDLTTTGSGVALARTFQLLNRRYDNSSYIPWGDRPQITAGALPYFSADELYTTHKIFNVDDVVFMQGLDLPGGLDLNTPYYVVSSGTGSLGSFYGAAVKLSATKGGTAINLTDNGTGSLAISGPAAYNSASNTGQTQYMTNGQKNLIIIARRGDYLDVTLHGVGTIQFYFRNMEEVFGTGEVGFYWQTPARVTSNVQLYPVITTLHAAWIDAPDVESFYRKNSFSHLNNLSSTNPRLPGRLELIPASSTLNTFNNTGSMFTNSAKVESDKTVDYALVAGGRGLATHGTFGQRTQGANIFTEGAYTSFPNLADSNGIGEMYFAPAVQHDTILAPVQSATVAPTNVNLASTSTVITTDPGETETVIITGYLTGTGTQRLMVELSTPSSTLPFDSGSSLDSVAGSFRLEVLRKHTTAYTHLCYSTLVINGTTIGPQRTAYNYAADQVHTFKYYYVRAIQQNANSVVIEGITKTFNKTKLR